MVKVKPNNLARKRAWRKHHKRGLPLPRRLINRRCGRKPGVARKDQWVAMVRRLSARVSRGPQRLDIAHAPAEIILAIGEYAVKDSPNAAIALAGVCRSWRQVVCSERKLWSRLILDQKADMHKSIVWSERSKTRVTNLVIAPRYESWDLDSWFSKGFQVCNAHVRDLVLRGDSTARVMYFLNPLCVTDDSAETSPSTHPEFNKDSNSVTPHVTRSFMRQIKASDKYHFQLTIRYNHQAITSLELDQVSFDARIFRQMPYLQRLVIKHCELVYANDDRAIRLPRLRKLAFEGKEFPAVRMPELASLDMYKPKADWVRAPLVNMLAFVRTLTFIDLGNGYFRESRLISLLPLLKQVRFLGLSTWHVTDRTIQCLFAGDPRSGAFDLCPNLIALSLAHSRATLPTLRDLINWRLPEEEWIMNHPIRQPYNNLFPFQPPSWRLPKVKGIRWPADVPNGLPFAKYLGAWHRKGDKPRIHWLSIRRHNPEIVDMLRQRVAYVWEVCSEMDQDQLRGTGRCQWDAEGVPKDRGASCGLYQGECRECRLG